MSKRKNAPNSYSKTTLAAYQGPLPPASQLQAYEDVVSGAADRIIKTYEKQVSHRHSIESKYIVTQCRNSTLGVVFGALISLVSILMSGYLIFSGHPTGGSIIGLGSLGSLVGVFIYGTKMKTGGS